MGTQTLQVLSQGTGVPREEVLTRGSFGGNLGGKEACELGWWGTSVGLKMTARGVP